jgi:uridine phosphorylase
MVLESATEALGLRVEQLGVAPVVVLAWSLRVVRSLAATVGAVLSEHWIYHERHPLYTAVAGGQRIAIAHVPVGAPGTITMMEEMIAAGARVFWGLSSAGSLQPDVPIGACIIATAALSEEGTSAHYVAAGTPLAPDPCLPGIAEQSCDAEGLAARSGPVWTTDAPYRETRAKIVAYQQRGILGVDMETSAMYALGQVRGVSVCNLLVVSDEPWREWRLGGPVFDEARARAVNAVLRCVAATPTGLIAPRCSPPHGGEQPEGAPSYPERRG